MPWWLALGTGALSAGQGLADAYDRESRVSKERKEFDKLIQDAETERERTIGEQTTKSQDIMNQLAMSKDPGRAQQLSGLYSGVQQAGERRIGQLSDITRQLKLAKPKEYKVGVGDWFSVLSQGAMAGVKGYQLGRQMESTGQAQDFQQRMRKLFERELDFGEAAGSNTIDTIGDIASDKELDDAFGTGSSSIRSPYERRQ